MSIITNRFLRMIRNRISDSVYTTNKRKYLYQVADLVPGVETKNNKKIQFDLDDDLVVEELDLSSKEVETKYKKQIYDICVSFETEIRTNFDLIRTPYKATVSEFYDDTKGYCKQGGRILICYHKETPDTIIGYLEIIPTDPAMYKNMMVYSTVYIIPDARKKGIAKAMISALNGVLKKEHNVDRVGLNSFSQNTAANKLYAKLGFKTHSEFKIKEC